MSVTVTFNVNVDFTICFRHPMDFEFNWKFLLETELDSFYRYCIACQQFYLNRFLLKIATCYFSLWGWYAALNLVSELDGKLFAERMAKLPQNNEETSGDEDSEEEEDTRMWEVDVENAGSGNTTEWNSIEIREWLFFFFFLNYLLRLYTTNFRLCIIEVFCQLTND